MTKPNFTFNIKNYSVEVTRREDAKCLSYQIIYTRESDNGKCCHLAETNKLKNTPNYWTTEEAKNYASDFIQKYETEYNEFYYI
tara:strand:+ start:133 stop:384 length:252 start_codon:yes stop_codon:yes gene_type:complete